MSAETNQVLGQSTGSVGTLEVVGNVKGTVVKSVKEQPVATLAAAVVIGFVVGALSKS